MGSLGGPKYPTYLPVVLRWTYEIPPQMPVLYLILG